MSRSPFASPAFAAALALCTLLSGAVEAKVLISADEALALAFPGCTIEHRTVYLTASELARAEALAGTALASAVVHPYRATADDRVCGTGYLDTHRVRTLAETVLVAIDAAGKLLRVEVLTFDEPPDYLPRAEWYRRFDGHPLDAGLEPGRDLPPVTGATLTVRATTDAARRALALHEVLAARPGEKSAKAAEAATK